MKLYDVFSPTNEFVLRAPLRIVGWCLQCHYQAEKRIMAETANGGECVVHHHDKYILGERWHSVRRVVE